MDKILDVIIIGAGQSGLACAYYLRRSSLDYIILDKQHQAGGAWQNAWDSLTLFSPAEHNSLPGWPMPKSENQFPLKHEVVDYLDHYEQRYQLPVKRDVRVETVTQHGSVFRVQTDKENYFAKTVIAATGTWDSPFIPNTTQAESFKGIQIHSSAYRNAAAFSGMKVLVVGEGNSGAQILADLSKTNQVKWSTRKPPRYLPDDINGFDLFNAASAKYIAEKEGTFFDTAKYDLGNIVMVPAVKDARNRNILQSTGTISSFHAQGVVWPDGSIENFDAIIWCTGFGYTTSFLKTLVTTDPKGIIQTLETKATDLPGLWLVGYGAWTGYASATLIGVNRTAKQTVSEIIAFLNNK